MISKKGFVDMLQRDRHPGDLVFAVLFLLISAFLVSQLGDQASWVKRTRFFAQPAFWPTVSLIGMLFFAALHCLGSFLSPRTPGRGAELMLWLRSLEYAAWFLVYVWVVPMIGYLGATILFTLMLTYRVGYRTKSMFIGATAMAVGIVVIFKAFLQVKIPAGQIYEYLPDGIRNFMLLYL
jgi:hypothetical protein